MTEKESVNRSGRWYYIETSDTASPKIIADA